MSASPLKKQCNILTSMVCESSMIETTRRVQGNLLIPLRLKQNETPTSPRASRSTSLKTSYSTKTRLGSNYLILLLLLITILPSCSKTEAGEIDGTNLVSHDDQNEQFTESYAAKSGKPQIDKVQTTSLINHTFMIISSSPRSCSGRSQFPRTYKGNNSCRAQSTTTKCPIKTLKKAVVAGLLSLNRIKTTE